MYKCIYIHIYNHLRRTLQLPRFVPSFPQLARSWSYLRTHPQRSSLSSCNRLRKLSSSHLFSWGKDSSLLFLSSLSLFFFSSFSCTLSTSNSSFLFPCLLLSTPLYFSLLSPHSSRLFSALPHSSLLCFVLLLSSTVLSSFTLPLFLLLYSSSLLYPAQNFSSPLYPAQHFSCL